MSIAANVLVVLGNVLVLLVAELAIKCAKRGGNLALDRFLFGDFILGHGA